MDVEHPVKLVLDSPVAPSDLQKSLWRHVCRQDIVANERLVGMLALLAPAQCDSADGCEAGKVMGFGQVGAHDGCRSGLASIVGRQFDLLGAAALSRSSELLRNGLEQGATIGLDCKGIV